jgi:hypothetical protein
MSRRNLPGIWERAKASLPWVKDLRHRVVTFVGLSEVLGGLGALVACADRYPARRSRCSASPSAGLLVLMLAHACGFPPAGTPCSRLCVRPPLPAATPPRVLGTDDFALRKGRASAPSLVTSNSIAQLIWFLTELPTWSSTGFVPSRRTHHCPRSLHGIRPWRHGRSTRGTAGCRSLAPAAQSAHVLDRALTPPTRPPATVCSIPKLGDDHR